MFLLILERQRKRERERERERGICCLLHTPYWELGPQPGPVPWPRIKLATFWCMTPNQWSRTSQRTNIRFSIELAGLPSLTAATVLVPHIRVGFFAHYLFPGKASERPGLHGYKNYCHAFSVHRK
uniref:Uncharacterized protein n=1 Tax=Myotis myotis TaxID=51298 RepID=A0A7J8ANH0_MYOMY|nr:hypothetical protein mMyoMyo1_008214 [Myotis myotis]